MSTDSINFVRDFVHLGSLTVLAIVIILAVIGLFKPQLFRKIFQEFAQRRYILASAVFVGLLCATVYVSTEAPHETYESHNMKESVTATSSFQADPPSTEQNVKGTATDEGFSYGSSTRTPSQTSQPSAGGQSPTTTSQNSGSQPATNTGNSFTPTNNQQPAPTPTATAQPSKPTPKPVVEQRDCKINILNICI